MKKCAEKAKCIEEMISTKEIEEMHDAIDNCRLKAQALALKLRFISILYFVFFEEKTLIAVEPVQFKP